METEQVFEMKDQKKVQKLMNSEAELQQCHEQMKKEFGSTAERIREKTSSV